VTVRPTKATVSGLAHSPHRSKFVLKGGVLLAAYGLRRPTTDSDGAALQTSNQAEDIRQFVVAVKASRPVITKMSPKSRHRAISATVRVSPAALAFSSNGGDTAFGYIIVNA
jgi:hypothetical protein